MLPRAGAWHAASVPSGRVSSRSRRVCSCLCVPHGFYFFFLVVCRTGPRAGLPFQASHAVSRRPTLGPPLASFLRCCLAWTPVLQQRLLSRTKPFPTGERQAREGKTEPTGLTKRLWIPPFSPPTRRCVVIYDNANEADIIRRIKKVYRPSGAHQMRWNQERRICEGSRENQGKP